MRFRICLFIILVAGLTACNIEQASDIPSQTQDTTISQPDQSEGVPSENPAMPDATVNSPPQSNSADSDQVTNYAVNLVEFHEVSRQFCEGERAIVAPILVQTHGSYEVPTKSCDAFHLEPWGAVLRTPLRCDGSGLRNTLEAVLGQRRGRGKPSRNAWLASRFSPSSTILDAAISLFGEHDVSAISEHAGSVARIDATTSSAG